MAALLTRLRSLPLFPPSIKPLAGYRRLAGASDPEPIRAQHEAPPPKSLVAQLPILLLEFFLLLPQPSLISIPIILYKHDMMSPGRMVGRIFASSSLFLMCNLFIILCLARDPGRPRPSGHSRGGSFSSPTVPSAPPPTAAQEPENEEEMSLTDFLKGPPPPIRQPTPPPKGRWCRICDAPKPERTHHCSSCNRCYLKMDHHCVWLATCVGFRTLPSFFLFLCTATLYAANGFSVGGPQMYKLVFTREFEYELEGDGMLVLVHSAILTMLGFVFTGCLFGFAAYHAYLISTNQTTLEQLHPYILVPFLPPPKPYAFTPPEELNLPSNSRPNSLYARWDEYYMNHDQRRTLRSAGKKIRMWDLGLTQNWASAFGGKSRSGWYTLTGKGDGTMFLHNPRAEQMLERLVTKLERQGPTPDQAAGNGYDPRRGEDWDSDE
ncbi:zf-DHHC-domain-containing protein [Calocera cornea HHB12733]|uniref:Palmitoyltransferase n=1 Tax=Calocera cornea HHB12733 TaxID=1353952 RepID=A0A165ET08_9BASI|nr:zf-DHHC-domain-containing protein [Calocera cornea HHB12733]